MASWLKNLIGFEITSPHTGKEAGGWSFSGRATSVSPSSSVRTARGKTSIAKALKNLQLVEDGGSTARHQALLIPRSAARAGNAEVHVFDQAYIDENVRFRPADAGGQAAKGVKTIVLLGDQGPIAKRIDEVKARIEGMEADKQALELHLLERTESLKVVKEKMKAVKAELWDKVAAEVEAPRSALSEALHDLPLSLVS